MLLSLTKDFVERDTIYLFIYFKIEKPNKKRLVEVGLLGLKVFLQPNGPLSL